MRGKRAETHSVRQQGKDILAADFRRGYGQSKHALKRTKGGPGYYGQFQEAGWRPAPYIQRTPDHFLRRAKADHMNDLHKRLEDALRGTLAELEKVVKANKGKN